MKKKLLIFDATSVLAENYYSSLTKEVEFIEKEKSSGVTVEGYEVKKAYSTLLNNKGMYINAIQGFFKEFFDAIDKTQPTHVITVWGAERVNNSRRNVLSSYKNDGQTKSAALLNQQETVIKMLKSMGFMTITSKNNEALDLAATIATTLENKFDNVEIFARNRLSLQLTDIATVWFKTPRYNQISNIYNLNTLDYPAGTIKYTKDLLLVDKGLKPNQIPDYAALVGNSYFGVTGAKEVGIKTATPLVQEFGSIENIYNLIDECKNHEELIELGISLKDMLMLPINPIEYLIKSRDDVFASKEVSIYKRDVFSKQHKDKLEMMYNQGFMNIPTDKKDIVKNLRELGISAFIGRFTGKACEIISEMSYSSLIVNYNPYIFSPSSVFYIGSSDLSLVPSDKNVDGEDIPLVFMCDNMVKAFSEKQLIADVSNTLFYSKDKMDERASKKEEYRKSNKKKIIEIDINSFRKDEEEEIIEMTSTLL